MLPKGTQVAREQRRLAAIMAVDVVGYSRLMGRDESGTLARLKVGRARHFEPALARHGGRLAKLTGDGALAEFGSAADALAAAIEFQEAMAEVNREESPQARLDYRVGLHLGDLIVDEEDLYGDSINVAARLQGEAPPGGIILSASVHEAVAGRLACSFEDLGPLALKHINRSVRAFRVAWSASDWAVAALPKVDSPGTVEGTAASPTNAGPVLALPDQPSIAVLPFTNMSDDAGQEYLADGVTDEIITALSRFRSLFVIARDSTFAYKGRAVDVRTIARELGVRYVLAGSVRRAGNRMRITGQLVQADTGVHIWVERYDGDLADIFDLQDKVASDVVGAIAPTLERAEIERVGRKPTGNSEAYDTYLRGMSKFYLWTMQGTDEARPLFHQAIELDPGFAAAHAMAAHLYSHSKAWGVALDRAKVAETAGLARRAVDLAPDDAFVLALAGWALAYAARDLSPGVDLIERAVLSNPNLAVARFASGFVNVWLGKPEVAIVHLGHAMRLSPSDPATGPSMIAIAHAHFMAERYDEAMSWATKAVHVHPVPSSMRIAAASAASAGRLDEAKSFIEQMRQADPTRRLSNVEDTLGPYRRPADLERYKDALRLAGLPE
jgi:TolB-like protein/class 3 adenylate cyclase/Tfp pilus assembly protein PilF